MPAFSAEITGIPAPSAPDAYIQPHAINNAGSIVGFLYPLGGGQTAVSYGNGHLTYLYPNSYTDPYTSYSYATGINNAGKIVGNIVVTGPFQSGQLTESSVFSYTGASAIISRSVNNNAVGYAINNSGQIVGTAAVYPLSVDAQPLPQNAFLYSGGQLIELGTLFGPSDNVHNSSANAINDSGQIVGVSDALSGGQHAFLYTGGQMSDLGTLGGMNSTATGINDAGQIIGISDLAGKNAQHAFLYAGGHMIDLRTLNGAMDSTANGINAAGEIVGQSDGLAFLYENGQMLDLNSLLPANSGWDLQDATAINDEGQIVGNGFFDGNPEGFILDTASIPEPAIIALLGPAAVLLGLTRKRFYGS